MNAAIQLINQSVVEDEHFEKQFNNVSLFEQAPEQKLRRALNYIMQLQAEIRVLREELARSERTTVHCEQLLRNATVRELELRAQLVKEVYR
jgi:CRISPR/Cas system-associated endonuclease Cas1